MNYMRMQLGMVMIPALNVGGMVGLLTSGMEQATEELTADDWA